MARSQPGKPTQGRMRYGIKGPLLFSAVLGLVAGVATSIFATGGGNKEFRLDLGLTAAGIAFIASLVICAMLMMAEAPNAENLGKGSGVNRSSAKPDRPAAQTQSTGSSTSTQPDPAQPDAGEPRYGQRLPDNDA